MKSIQTICFDLETLPDGDYPTPGELKPPAQLKKPESIEAWKNDPKNLEAEYKKRSLSPIEGRILSIAWVLDDEPVRSVINADEHTVLLEFESHLKEQFKARFSGDSTIVQPTLIAHNGKTFDISFLWLRAMKYEMEWLLKVIGDNVDDIRQKDTMMIMGVLNGYRTYVSLSAACKFFGIKGKTDGMTGADVYPYFKEGRLEEIRKYCAEDTTALYQLAKKLKIVF